MNAENFKTDNDDFKWFVIEDLDNRILEIDNIVKNVLKFECKEVLLDIQELNQ